MIVVIAGPMVLLRKVLVMKFFRRMSSVVCLLFLTVVLVACGKVNADNYGKLKAGQSVDEVKAILGEPSEGADKGVNIGGHNGAMSWKDGDKSITVTFLAGKATLMVKNGF